MTLNHKEARAMLKRARRAQRAVGAFSAQQAPEPIDKGTCWVCGKRRTGTTLDNGTFVCGTCATNPGAGEDEEDSTW